MNDSDFRALLEKSWRNPLTDEEQVQLNAWLATRPEARATWEEEAALNRSLQNLPDAPLSSNFTALVLQAVEQEKRQAAVSRSRSASTSTWWRRFTWGLGWALFAISAGWIGVQQYQTNNLKTRRDIATGLSALATTLSESDPAVLEDFDAIQRLSLTSGEDEELYAVLSN